MYNRRMDERRLRIQPILSYNYVFELLVVVELVVVVVEVAFFCYNRWEIELVVVVWNGVVKLLLLLLK